MRPLLVVLALLAACTSTTGGGGPDPSGEASLPVVAGPLANAGPDRLVLQGSVVTLDARASVAGDDQRGDAPPAVRWSQTGGPPVVLDDGAATVSRFVAPAARVAGEPLKFELRVDDGRTVSRDDVAIFVVDQVAKIRPPFVLLGGADQRVEPGATFTLPVRVLRFGCPDDPEDAVFCELAPDGTPTGEVQLYPYCIEQVEGPAVHIPEGFDCDGPLDVRGVAQLRAPEAAGAVLSFRIQARDNDFVEDSSLPFANQVLPAPDHVRVRVGAGDAEGCTAQVTRDTVPVEGGLEGRFPFFDPRSKLVLSGSDDCEGPGRRHSIFRPLMGAPEIQGTRQGWPSPRFQSVVGFCLPGADSCTGTTSVELPLLRQQPWSQHVAVLYEVLSDDRLWSAPAVVGYFLDASSEGIEARLAPPPCTVGRTCSSVQPVVLDGTASTQGDTMRYCWTQTRGPDLREGGDDLVPGREVCSSDPQHLLKTLQLPPPIKGESAARSYAFLLQVEKRTEDGRHPLGRSAPAALVFDEVSPENLPPVAVANGDGELREQETLLLDGRCSYDPDVQPDPGPCGRTLLSEYIWTAVPQAGVPEVDPPERVACPNDGTPRLDWPTGTCARVKLPTVTTNHVCDEGVGNCFRFQLQVSDANAAIGTAILHVNVRDTVNEPPVARVLITTPGGRTATEAIVVRGGQDVILDPRGSSDPNGLLASCTWTYQNRDPTKENCDPEGRNCLAERLPRDPGDFGPCAGERLRVRVPPVSSNVPFQQYAFRLTVRDTPPCTKIDGGCTGDLDRELGDLTSVSLYALKDGPWVSASADPTRALGSPDRPLLTLQDALALARDPELAFDVIHVKAGSYTIDAATGERVLLANRTIIGSYFGDRFTEYAGGSSRTVFYTAQGVVLQDGAYLRHVDVRLDGPGREAIAVQKIPGEQDDVVLDDVRVSVDRSAAPVAHGIHLDGGDLVMNGGLASGRVSGGPSTGLHCEQGSLFASGAVLSGGGGTGTHRGVYLDEGCRADLRDSTLRGVDPGPGTRNQPGVKDGLAIGLDSVSQQTVFLAATDDNSEACVVQGGRAEVAATGARVLRALFSDCVIEGGQAPSRTGLEVRSPGTSLCAGVECVTAYRGRIVGGSGSVTGQARGVLAHNAVRLESVRSILGDTGETGGAGEAYGVDLELGGTLVGLPSVRGGDVAETAWGILSARATLLLQDSTVVAGTAVVDRATGLEARGPVLLDGVLTVRAASGDGDPPATARGILVGAGGSVEQLERDGAYGVLVDTGPASSTAQAISSSGSVDLANARLLAGPAPEVTVAHSAGPLRLLSSLLHARPGDGATTVLSVQGGAPELRSVILDPGGTRSASRAHVDVADASSLPEVLSSVVFTPDPLCDASGGYLLVAGRRVCSVTAIEAEGTGYSALVVDPQFVDAAGGDFHLRPASAAVDAGDEAEFPVRDADGNPRPLGDPPVPDVGPYEQ